MGLFSIGSTSVQDIREFDPGQVYFLIKKCRSISPRSAGVIHSPDMLTNVISSLLLRDSSPLERHEIECAISAHGGVASVIDDDQIGKTVSMEQVGIIYGSVARHLLLSGFTSHEVMTIRKTANCRVIACGTNQSSVMQSICDIYTILEQFNWKPTGLKLAIVGNVGPFANDLLILALMVGLNVVVAIPEQTSFSDSTMRKAADVSSKTGAKYIITHDPREAVVGANIIGTAPWYNPFYKTSTEKSVAAFVGFQVNSKLCETAAPNWVFLHHLGGHGDEVTEEVYSGSNSLVTKQAKNLFLVPIAFLENNTISLKSNFN